MAENEKNFLIVDTDEAGQITGMRRMEAGDTISNDRLNTDVRNAPSDASTALATAQSAQNTATSAIEEAESVSSTVYANSGTWGAGGIDPTDLNNLKDVSTGFSDFSSNGSGTLAGKDTIDSADLLGSQVVDPSSVKNNSITASQISNTAGITNAQLAGNIALNKLATTTADSIIGTDNGGQPAAITATVARSNMGLGNLAILDSVTNSQIVSGAVQTTNILDGGVTRVKIDADAIDGTKLADDAVSNEHIVDDAVQSAQIKALNVTNEKLAGDIPQHKLASSGISRIFVTGTSGVPLSGSIDGDAAPAPANGAVMVIDTTAGRIKFRDKISGTRIEDATIPPGALVNASITNTQLAAGAAVSNLAAAPANSINYNSLPLVNANSFVGNDHPTNGATMGQITNTSARNMLGLSAGTTAPPSPAEGDLWYNTTTDVDELFAYDSGRGKWLGVNSFCINAGRNGTIGSDVGHFGIMDNREMNPAVGTKRGFQVPFDCTVVGWAWSAGTDTTGWQHRLARYDDSAGSTTQNVHTYSPAGTYDNWEELDLDVDFDQRDIIGYSAIVATSPTGTIVNQNLTIIIKRRTS